MQHCKLFTLVLGIPHFEHSLALNEPSSSILIYTAHNLNARAAKSRHDREYHCHKSDLSEVAVPIAMYTNRGLGTR